MEGGGNMKREGEGHRETERVSKEKKKKSEERKRRVVSGFSVRGRDGKVRVDLIPFSTAKEE